MARIPPQVNAFLLCDRVIQQAGTHKWCAIGTQDVALVPALPAPISLGVFLSLGDVPSGTRPQIVLRSPHGEPLLQAEAQPQYHAGDARGIVGLELGMQLPLLPFADSGAYRIELVIERKVIAHRELRVVEGERWEREPEQGPCTLRSLVLCDQAFQHHGRSSWSLIGIFDALHVQALPARHAPFVVFWSLAGFRGDATVVATVRDNEGGVVYALRAHIPRLPGDTVEVAFPFPPLDLQRSGSHTVELHVGEQLVGMRSFHVFLSAPTQRLPI
ncbi:MAG: hypothetical protein IPN34_15330 [Planctomycetes bacterium]|nr:hypothetical protein [Planctomycetota bacterium]